MPRCQVKRHFFIFFIFALTFQFLVPAKKSRKKIQRGGGQEKANPNKNQTDKKI